MKYLIPSTILLVLAGCSFLMGVPTIENLKYYFMNRFKVEAFNLLEWSISSHSILCRQLQNHQ